MSILVSDFDCTYDKHHHDIELNRVAIQKFIEAGNYFVLSSSRPLNSLLRKVKEHDIPYNYLGTCDGNYLFDSKLNRIYSCTIPSEIVLEIKKLANIRGVEGLQYVYPTSYSINFDENEPLGSVAFVVKDENVTPEFIEMFNRLKTNYPDFQYKRDGNRGIGYYKIRPLGLSKSNPITFLGESLQIPKSDIYTIGDEENDFEMIRDFNGFRVSHNKELKEVALKRYRSVHDLVDDITNNTALKR